MLRRNELVDAWLDQAGVDLQAAKFLLSSSDPNLSSVVCYHAQQAAEKALKAQSRYPGMGPQPTLEQAQEALVAAEEVMARVSQLLQS